MTQLPPDALAALQSGRLIEAIKIVRDRTGMDLKTAKAFVERHANQLDANPAQHESGQAWQEADWGRDGSSPSPAGSDFSASPTVPAAAREAMARGHKVEAVRMTREATGLGLAAAKALVEGSTLDGSAFAADQDAPPAVRPSRIASDPMAEPGRVSGGVARWLPILLVLLVAALVWMYSSRGA